MKTYFIFGSDAADIYNDNGIEAVIEAYEANEISYHTFVYNDEIHKPAYLLHQFKGNEDYAEISEEEYNLLTQ